MPKILAIGNSFSQDATALLPLMSDELFVRNMYIGGCSLERHCENLREDKSEYLYEENGAVLTDEKVSLRTALCRENWDCVTLQQASGFSGIEESYYPYLPELMAYVRKFTSAEIVLHRTWPYELGSTHPDFARYGNDFDRMWHAIESTYDSVAQREGLRVIDTGRAIYDLRRMDVFDHASGGASLYRDGFHLSYNYGRFVAAAVWRKFFTGAYPRINGGSPAFDAIKAYLAERDREG